MIAVGRRLHEPTADYHQRVHTGSRGFAWVRMDSHVGFRL